MPWVFHAVEYHEELDVQPTTGRPDEGGFAADSAIWIHASIGRMASGAPLRQGASRYVCRVPTFDAWVAGDGASALQQVREEFFAEHEALQWQIVAPTPLAVLELSTRARNVLQHHTIRTVEALQHLPHGALPRFRNLGKRSLAEITQKLQAWEDAQPVEAAASEPYWQRRYDAEVTRRGKVAEQLTGIQAQLYAALTALQLLRRELYERGHEDGTES